MAPAAAKLVSGVPRLGPAVTRALEGGTRLQRAGATAALNAPIDIAQGIKADRPFLLPESTGTLGAIAENVGLTGAIGGVLPAARIPESRRLGAGGQRALPPSAQRLLPAPAAREVVEEVAPAATQPRTFYGAEAGAPSTVPPRTFYGQPSGPASLELPGAAQQIDEVVPPPAAAAEPLQKVAPAAQRSRARRGREVSDIVEAKTGQPFNSTMWRGEGGSAVQGTGDAAILGPARYTTPDKNYASEFALDANGKMVGKVSQYEVNLKNPLVIDSDKQWRALTKRAGWFSPNPTGMPPEELTQQISTLRRLVEADGHDGIIVRIPREYKGVGPAMRMGPVDERYGKTLDRVFGADQVIEFAPTGNRPGFADVQALTTLAGGGVGALAGGLTGTDRESSIAGIISGGLLGAGAGLGVGSALRGRAPQVARGSTPDIQEVNRTINVGDRPRTTKPWLSTYDNFMTRWFASTRPMELAAREAMGAQGEQILSQRIAQAQGAGQAAKQYIYDNIMPSLVAARGKFDDVRALLKARRDLNIRVRGGAEKSDVATDVLERAIRDAEADPAVKQAADVINQTYRDLLKRRYQAGIITFAQYKNILDSEDFFSPFVREFVDDVNAAGPAGRGKRWTVSSSGVKRMDRTMQASAQTADPLEVVLSSVERTFNDVGRQNVQNVLATFADLDRIPNLIRRVDGEVTPGAATFTQMRSGRPVQYEVLEKELFDAIAGQSPSSLNTMFLLKMPAVALRMGVTLRPAFAFKNAIRDIAMSGIQRPDVQRAIMETAGGGVVGGGLGAATAEEGERLKGFLQGAGMGMGVGAYIRPVAQTMLAMRNVIGATLPENAPEIIKQMTGDGEPYKAFLRLGGSTEGFYVRNAGEAQEFLKRMERSGTIKDIIDPGSIWRALTYIGSVSEQSTRLAAFRQLKDAGFTDAAAVLGAQDRTLRFAQRGKIGAKAADIAAFWNPRMQGVYKLGRMLRDPKTWGMGAAMITAPSVALWNVNKDNPEYWKTPVWERNMFWLIPKSGGPDEYGEVGFWRIPKPFEIGLLFASLPERFLDAAAQSGVKIPLLDTGETAAPLMAEPTTALKETVGTAVGEAGYGLLPIPTAAQVPLQLLTNRDIFRGRPIVSRPDIPAAQQVTEESSALARVLAERGISPQKTDFTVRGIFGGMGSDVSNIIDRVVRAAGGAAPSESRPFFRKEFETRTYSSTEQEVSARERLRRLEGIHRGLLKEEASNDDARILRYEERNRDALDMWQSLKSYKTELDNIAAERRAVIADKRIPQDERKQILGQLRKEADAAARDVLAFKFD